MFNPLNRQVYLLHQAACSSIHTEYYPVILSCYPFPDYNNQIPVCTRSKTFDYPQFELNHLAEWPSRLLEWKMNKNGVWNRSTPDLVFQYYILCKLIFYYFFYCYDMSNQNNPAIPFHLPLFTPFTCELYLSSLFLDLCSLKTPLNHNLNRKYEFQQTIWYSVSQ